jgi:hypothetical protein
LHRFLPSLPLPALYGLETSTPAEAIWQKIRPFIDPALSLGHGRWIGVEAAQQCGLVVGEIPLDSDTWRLVWELYVRAAWCVVNQASKLAQTQ